MSELWSVVVFAGLIGTFAVARRFPTLRFLLTGNDDAPAD
jgi:hypothetical protein